MRAVQDDRAHADENLVFHGAGVDDGFVSDGDQPADDGRQIIRRVDNRTILHIGPGTQDDMRNITAQDRLVPHAGFGPDLHIGHHGGIVRDVRILRDARCGADITGNGFGEFLHQTKGRLAHTLIRPPARPPVKPKSGGNFSLPAQ